MKNEFMIAFAVGPYKLKIEIVAFSNGVCLNTEMLEIFTAAFYQIGSVDRGPCLLKELIKELNRMDETYPSRIEQIEVKEGLPPPYHNKNGRKIYDQFK